VDVSWFSFVICAIGLAVVGCVLIVAPAVISWFAHVEDPESRWDHPGAADERRWQ
jgi:hypothetical protein